MQYIDSECKLIYPWYTKPFLDILSSWKTTSPLDTPISKWNVFEWGSGNSTIWWDRHCLSLMSIDHCSAWVKDVSNAIASKDKTQVKYREISFGSTIGTTSPTCSYVTSINETSNKYDCVIIDGEYGRNTCAQELLKKDVSGNFKHLNIPSIVILDNADQKTIELSSTETFELLKDYKHFSYKEPRHVDWRTDYWIIDRLF